MILGDPETLPETQASRHPLKTRQMLDTSRTMYNIQATTKTLQECKTALRSQYQTCYFGLFVAWSFCLFICLSFCHFVLCFEENCPQYCHQSFLNEIAREILKYFDTFFEIFLGHLFRCFLDTFRIFLRYFLDVFLDISWILCFAENCPQYCQQSSTFCGRLPRETNKKKIYCELCEKKPVTH